MSTLRELIDDPFSGQLIAAMWKHDVKDVFCFIRKVKGGYVVKSHTGKRLSKPSSKQAAQKRLRQIEYFKHHKGG